MTPDVKNPSSRCDSRAFRSSADSAGWVSGGEGGIRTHVRGLTRNPISSRARYGQLRYLSAFCTREPLFGRRGCIGDFGVGCKWFGGGGAGGVLDECSMPCALRRVLEAVCVSAGLRSGVFRGCSVSGGRLGDKCLGLLPCPFTGGRGWHLHGLVMAVWFVCGRCGLSAGGGGRRVACLVRRCCNERNAMPSSAPRAEKLQQDVGAGLRLHPAHVPHLVVVEGLV